MKREEQRLSPAEVFARVVDIARQSEAVERSAKMHQAMTLLSSTSSPAAALVLACLRTCASASVRRRNSFDRLAFSCLIKSDSTQSSPLDSSSSSHGSSLQVQEEGGSRSCSKELREEAKGLLFEDRFVTNFAGKFVDAFGLRKHGLVDDAELASLCQRYMDRGEWRAAGNVLAYCRLYDRFEPDKVYRQVLKKAQKSIALHTAETIANASPLGSSWRKGLISAMKAERIEAKKMAKMVTKLKLNRDEYPELKVMQMKAQLQWLLRSNNDDAIEVCVQQDPENLATWVCHQLLRHKSYGPNHVVTRRVVTTLGKLYLFDQVQPWDGTEEWTAPEDGCLRIAELFHDASKSTSLPSEAEVVKQRVTVVNTPQLVTDARDVLFAANTVGMDCEFSVCDSNKCCMVQLATRDQAFIIDTLHLATSEWSPIIADLLVSNAKLVGFGLKHDLAILNLHEEVTLPSHRPALTDLQGLAARKSKARRHHGEGGKEDEKKINSLSDLCEQYLGKPMDKTFRISAWERRPLRLPQRVYAALDAFVCVHIHDILERE